MNPAVLIDIGNVIFFIASLPQIRTAYKNRKDLKAISNVMLLGFTVSCFLFAAGNAGFGAMIAAVLNVICSFVFIAQLYWKWKYR